MRFLSRFKLPSTWLAVLSPSNSLGPEAFVLSGVIIIQLAWSVLEGCAGTLSFQAHRSLDPGFRFVLRRSRFLYFLGVYFVGSFVQLFEF